MSSSRGPHKLRRQDFDKFSIGKQLQTNSGNLQSCVTDINCSRRGDQDGFDACETFSQLMSFTTANRKNHDHGNKWLCVLKTSSVQLITSELISGQSGHN